MNEGVPLWKPTPHDLELRKSIANLIRVYELQHKETIQEVGLFRDENGSLLGVSVLITPPVRDADSAQTQPG
jgi:hypothetical protein